MPLINAFKNPDAPDASPSPRTVTTDVHITIGGRSIPVTRSRLDEMAMRVASAVEAHRIAMRGARMRASHMRTGREGPSPGGWTGWVTSEGRPASDFPRVELVPHHPPELHRALLDRTEREDRSDQRRYRLVGLRERLEALQRPLAVLANEGASIARDGVGEWSREQADTLVRVSDLEAEVELLLEALRELF